MLTLLSVTGCCCRSPDCLFCRPCQIPTKNLTYLYTGASPLSPTTGSGALTFDGDGDWISDAFGSGFTIDLQCISNVVTPRIILSGVSQCTFGAAATTVCNPLGLVYDVPDPSAAYTAGFRTLTIGDPSPPTFCAPPCDCTNCKACGGIILLPGGSVADSNGTHAVAGITCTSHVTVSGLPLVVFPQSGPPATDCGLSTTDVDYDLCLSCHGFDDDVTITLRVYAVRDGCTDATGFKFCGYTPGLTETFTKVVTPVCSGGVLTATADFSSLLAPGGICHSDFGGNSGNVAPIVTSVTFSIPLGPTNAMCQSFVVTGCNGISIASVGESTVSVYDHEGGTLLYSGTTVSGGIPKVYFENTGVTYWITATSPDPRLKDFAGSKTLSCDGETSINLQPTDGYVCVPGCVIPLATSTVLHATHPVFGALSMTYDGSGSLGAGWYATVTYSYAGCQCCPSKTVTITCYLNRSLQFSDNWKSH